MVSAQSFEKAKRELGPRVHRLRGAFLRALGIFALVHVVACGGVSQNVRAYRAYANEDPNIKVQVDRVEDLAQTLGLVDRMLVGTSYTPGDMWPRRMPMTDAQFKTVRADLKDRYPYKHAENAEVPILKCYRYHIEQTFSEYGPPPEKGKYPSLLDAVGALNPRHANIKAHWVAYREATDALATATENEENLRKELSGLDKKARAAREPELGAAQARMADANAKLLRAAEDINRDSESLAADATLEGGDKETIARDAFYVLSVAFRIELEALALIPIVIVQTIRSLPQAPRDLTYKTNLKIVGQVWRMPAYVVGIKESFTKQAGMLDNMTSQLAKALKSSVEKSPGFELKESVVDQIVGITLDSFRVDLRAGADAFIFSSVGTADKTGGNEASYDYRGRAYKLDYRIQPIVLASARLDVVLDWIRMPGAANLGFGYSTDRVYKSGGSVDSNSFTNQLGIDGVASDVLDAALGVLGVRTNVKVANFTAGELRQVRATDVSTAVNVAPLRLKYTQVDVGYDILWLMNQDSLRAYMEEFVVGGRYTDYTLPRVIYELQDTSVDPAVQRFTFRRESPVQPVRSRFYMAAVNGRFGVGDAPRWSPFLDAGIAGGGGPIAYYFLRDPNGENTAANQEFVREAAFIVNASLGAGLRWRLLPRGSRLRLDARFYYRADMLYTIFNHTETAGGRALRTDLGSIDFFHSPSISIRGAL